MNTSSPTTSDHLPASKHRDYFPFNRSLYGQQGKVITDINVSLKVRNSLGHKVLTTRYYSIKTKTSGSWLLGGHSPRVILTDVVPEVSEKSRKTVVRTKSKIPHSYLVGTVSQVIGGNDPTTHEQIINQMRSDGAVLIGYDPYKSGSFLITENERLPSAEECSHLPVFISASKVYAYETGILAILN